MSTTEGRSHRVYNLVDENAASSRRPLLILNHHPKAGGGSLKTIIEAIKGPGVQTPRRSEEKVQIEVLEEAREHAENSFVIIPERMTTTLELHRARGFVIGSMREPCSHYVSYWAFGSAGRGGPRHYHDKHSPDVVPLYGKDAPRFNSPADIDRFRQWVQHKEIFGTIAEQTKTSYNGPSLNGVDCLVFVEAFQQSLVECLQMYEQQGRGAM